MAENVAMILNKGFDVWRKNLNICLPFVLETITSIVFYVFAMFVFTIIFIYPVVAEQNINLESIAPEEMLSMLSDIFSQSTLLLVLVGLVLLLIYMMMQAFFAAGAIGMAKKALETGTTNFGAMLESAKNNTFNLFLVNVLLSLLALAGLVLLIPGFLSIGDISVFLSNPESSIQSINLLRFGFMAWVLYLIALSIVFLLADYAVVADSLDPIAAIEKAYYIFKNNMFPVIIIWGLLVIIVVSFTLIGEGIVYVSVLNQVWTFVEFLISSIVIQPLFTVWLTRLYLSSTEQKLYSFDDYLLDD